MRSPSFRRRPDQRRAQSWSAKPNWIYWASPCANMLDVIVCQRVVLQQKGHVCRQVRLAKSADVCCLRPKGKFRCIRSNPFRGSVARHAHTGDRQCRGAPGLQPRALVVRVRPPHPLRRRDVERQVPGPQREWPGKPKLPPKAGDQPRPQARQPGRVDDQGAEPEHAAMREVRRVALQSATPDQVDRPCLAAPDRQIGVPGITHRAGKAGPKSRNCRRNCQIRSRMNCRTGKQPRQGP